MIKILFSNGGYPIKHSLVKRVIKIASRRAKKIKGEIEVNIVDGQTIKKLNKLFRQKNQVTDVLSFAWQEEKRITSPMLGQIFICYPQIKRQAKEYELAVETEFIRMLTHGLLHLVGHDHGNSREAKIMFALQEKIIGEVD